MNQPTSDFPEFDKAYKNMLIKNPSDRFEQLAAEANFSVYHSDIWRGTGRKFAELIVRECLDIAQDRAAFDGFPPNDVNHIIDEIKEHFGVEE
jgi:hypothetical protein